MSGRSWAVLSFTLVLVALAGAFTWLHISNPSDGARIQPVGEDSSTVNLVLYPLDPSPGDLIEGDILLSVGSHSIDYWSTALFNLGASRPTWEFNQIIPYTVQREAGPVEVPVKLGRYPLGAILRQEWGALVGLTISFLVAGYIFARRPELPSARAWFLATAGGFCSFPWALGLTINDLVGGIGTWLYILTTTIGYLLLWIAGLHFALVFPRPHKILSGRSWIIPSLYILPYLGFGIYAASLLGRGETGLAFLNKLNTPTGAVELVYLVLLVGAVVTNYRGNRDVESRHQVRWVVLALGIVGALTIAFAMIPETITGKPLLSWNGVALIGLMVPFSIAIAILRHRLFDIDLIINRALVYGALSAITMGLYILIVGYLGQALQAGNRSLIAFLTAGLVAVIFQPLRQWLQIRVNRWMYGERDDPYTVLSSLGKRLEASLAPETAFPIIVETIAQTLKLPYVAISLKGQGTDKIASSYGLPPHQSAQNPNPRSSEEDREKGPEARYEDLIEILPLVYQGEQIGQLILARRWPGEGFNPAERGLLEDIALQVSVAAYNIRLTEDQRQLTSDLQRSRERLVTAQEEERRRLRRDLHDGLGPQLASQTLTLEAIEKNMQRDPQEAISMLRALKEQSKAALQEVRRLVYELRPPALDDLGLVAALRESVDLYRQSGLQIELEADRALPSLPAAVELAAYRIVQEAITNVVKHAQATACEVHLNLIQEPDQEDREAKSLKVEVLDNGRGLPKEVKKGVGLQSMRERAEELGGKFQIIQQPEGGTRLSATLPLFNEGEFPATSRRIP
jgi:two-component system NarL family sensor kinase